MVDRYHLAAFGLVITLAIVLSASIGTTAGEPDPDALLEKAVDSLENESLEAVYTQRISRPDGEVTQTVVVHQRSSQSGYLEVIDSTEGNVGQQMLFNGSTVVRQDIDSGTAVRYEQSSDYLLDELRTVGVAPEVAADHYEGEFKGTAELDGRESYLVELNSPTKTTAGLLVDIDAGSLEYELPLHETTEEQWYLSQETWWIDKETFYPIKQTVEWVDEDGNIIATATREFEALAVGSAAEGDGFGRVSATNETGVSETDTVLQTVLSELETETATSATETDLTLIEPEVFETHNSADAAVPFDLPTIDTQVRYTYDRAIVHSHEEHHGVMLLYTDEETGSTLSVQIVEEQSPAFQYNTVIHTERISAFDGSLVVTDSGTAVVRECDDLVYRVRGPPEAETLIQVMESIEC